jgi:uncharacterized protein YndB with AHSA1/START domain
MTATASTADREIVITRVVDAPRDLVFQAWTEPQHVTHWYGPTGFTITIQEMDVRPGGVWLFIMHGPDGTDYFNRIAYHEVVRPERLVYTHSGDEAVDPNRFHVTTTFTDQGGKTLVVQRAVFETAAERDRVVREYHAIEGGKQTMDRLKQYLAKLQA